jgi:hypothetical protein
MSSLKIMVDISGDGSLMEFHLAFGDDWKSEDIQRFLGYMKTSKNVVNAFLTSSPEPDTIPA